MKPELKQMNKIGVVVVLNKFEEWSEKSGFVLMAVFECEILSCKNFCKRAKALIYFLRGYSIKIFYYF